MTYVTFFLASLHVYITVKKFKSSSKFHNFILTAAVDTYAHVLC